MIQPLTELLVELEQLQVRLNIRAQTPGGGDEGDADLVGVAAERLKLTHAEVERLRRIEQAATQIHRSRAARNNEGQGVAAAEHVYLEMMEAEGHRLLGEALNASADE